MEKRSKEDKSKNSNSSSSKEMSDKNKHSSHKSSKGNDKSSRSSRDSSEHSGKDSGYSSREQFGHSSKASSDYCTPKSFKSDSGGYYKKVHFDPIHIGPVSTLEEMDNKVLRIQNKKLGERLQERDRIVTSLNNKLKEIERRQINNDRTVNVVNRYWDQMNEDLNIILLRSEGVIDIENDNKNEDDETTSFVHQLATWDDGELETNLAERVHMSKQQVVKIVKQIDKYAKRFEELTSAMKLEDSSQMEREFKKLQVDIQSENLRLQAINKSLHQKAHSLAVKWREEKERSITRETLYSELARKHEEVCYDYENEKARSAKLEHHLAEALEGVKSSASSKSDPNRLPSDNQDNVSSEFQEQRNTGKSEEALKEIEKWKELSENRLHELEEMTTKLKQQAKEIAQLKSDVKQLPESIIVETPEYKSLQSQFSVLYNESIQMKTQLDEYYAMLVDNKNMYLNQIKTLESEDVMAQKKYRNDILTLQDYNSQIKKEYEVLRIEYEQNMVANEQTGPINKEMRQLITSLQIHNTQLKSESQRYRRKYKDIRKENEEMQAKYDDLYKTYGWRCDQTKDEGDLSDFMEEFNKESEKEKNRERGEHDKSRLSPDVFQEGGDKRGKLDSSSSSSRHSTPTSSKSMKKLEKVVTVSTKDLRSKDLKEQESELVRELKTQLKKSFNEQKEMKLLLDMYKTQGKDSRDKAQILASEKKLKGEVEELKGVVRKIQESKKEERKKLAEEDAVRKIKYLEDQVNQLQKQSSGYKQGEEVLLNEMEVTGQAFEDMQEQNTRLIQQLTEKDEENFKLMTERMKFTSSHKSTNAQNASLVEMKKVMDAQIEAMQLKTKKLEDKERLLTNAVAGLEKEVQLRTQAQELYKKKAIEVAQSAADYKLHVEKCMIQLQNSEQNLMSRVTDEEDLKFKINRMEEELMQLKKNEDRMKQMEIAGTLESVLSQEIRELRETLRCPSCKVEQKDAILTKCFHVFCYKCIKVRYDSRQRKCPKCNAAFGANDYHRIYLSG